MDPVEFDIYNFSQLLPLSMHLPPPVTPFSSAVLLCLEEINKNFLDFVMLIQGATGDREQLVVNNIAAAFNSRRQLDSHF